MQGPVCGIQRPIGIENGEGRHTSAEVGLFGCAVELSKRVVVLWKPGALVLVSDDPHDHHLGNEGIILTSPDCGSSGFTQADTGHGFEIEADVGRRDDWSSQG